MKIMIALVLSFILILISPLTGVVQSSLKSPNREVVVKQGQGVVIELFEEEIHRNTEAFISQQQDSRVGKLVEKCEHKFGNTFEKTKDVAFDVSSEFQKFKEHVKEVVGETVEKVVEQRNEKIHGTIDKCKRIRKLEDAFGKMKNIVLGDSGEFCNINEQEKEVFDEGVGKVGKPKEKHSEELSEKVKSFGGKAIEMAIRTLR